jgi:hypothetical protein
MERRRRSILGLTSFLPIVAISAYLLGIPTDSSALNCGPSECVYAGQCYAYQSCLYPGCSDGRGQQCRTSAGSSIPAWFPCSC